MRNLVFMLIMAILMLNLAACATMQGLGKDMENAGEWVQDKAR